MWNLPWGPSVGWRSGWRYVRWEWRSEWDHAALGMAVWRAWILSWGGWRALGGLSWRALSLGTVRGEQEQKVLKPPSSLSCYTWTSVLMLSTKMKKTGKYANMRRKRGLQLPRPHPVFRNEEARTSGFLLQCPYFLHLSTMLLWCHEHPRRCPWWACIKLSTA